jgi:glycosyltransferase involved in cell wall biosynthesis
MAQAWPPQHIAIIYDRVNTPYGGAELVLLAIHQAFPQADLLTSVVDLKLASWAKVFPKIKTSWLQNLPGAKNAHRWLAQFMPLAFETLDLSSYDLIISVTSAEAKGILTNPDQLHVCYLLTPPRYLYHQQTELLTASWLTNLPGVNWLAKLALSYLKWWDQIAVHRPDVIIPLSQRVANQLKTFYTLSPKTLTPVLYPPINTNQFFETKLPEQLQISQPYFLQVARLVPYKKVALSLMAAAKANQNLVIVGAGPDLKKLQNLAKKLSSQTTAQLQLLGSVSAETLASIYTNCLAVLMPGQEDFGLTALEANNYGKPVIINQLSGAAEVIIDQVHGFHLKDISVEALAKLMKTALKYPWNSYLLRQNAAKYGTSIFVTALTQRLKTYWQDYNQLNQKNSKAKYE